MKRTSTGRAARLVRASRDLRRRRAERDRRIRLALFDRVCRDLGLDVQPWQRAIAGHVLDGRRLALPTGRRS